jgi:transcriptional regulator with XRE-family HTH domain
MNFNDWLAAKKKELKISNRKIAQACEVSESAVGRWLRGERLPERRQVALLSKLFQVSPARILWMTDREALQEEMGNSMSQQDIASLLAHVPEAEEFYRILTGLSVEKRAALILIARGLKGTEGS